MFVYWHIKEKYTFPYFQLAGVVEPNDGQCHLQNGSYTHGLILDYPSIGQVYHLAID